MKHIIVLVFLLSCILFAQERNITIDLPEGVEEIIVQNEQKVCLDVNDDQPEFQEENEPEIVEPCTVERKRKGFKIQVFYSKEEVNAKKVQKEFKSKFPKTIATVQYFQPDYKVVVGSYIIPNLK